MKRTPIQRHTPLRSSSPLHRTSGINPVSKKRQRLNRERTRAVNGLREAQAGRCPRCRRTGLPIFGHEVRARAHGGSIIAPEVALCNDCNGAIEDAPQVSCWNGWKSSPKWPTDPVLPIGAARDLFGDVVIFAELAGEQAS